MKIVISAITGLRNRGVEALVVTTIEQLQQRLPQAEIVLMTETPDYDENCLKPYSNVRLVDCSYQRAFKTNRLGKLTSKITQFYKPLGLGYKTVKSTVQGASAVIASGGDMFSSDYGSSALYNNLRPLEISLESGVPVIFAAQSIGPFKTSAEAKAWSKVAQQSKLVTIREQLSYKYVTKDLGLSQDLVKHVADPAFLLNPTKAASNLLEAYAVDKEKPVVAFSVSQGISRYATGCNYEQHQQVLKQVIQFLINDLNVQVLLIPHVQEIKPKNDDRILATKLHRSLDFDPRVKLIGGDHTASEFKGIIAACDMVIAERMHAAIAGLSSGICTVVVGYSIKGEGILTDMLGAELLNDGVLIPLQQFVDAEIACKAVGYAWEQRDRIAKQLQEKLADTQASASLNFDMMAQCIQ